MTHPIAVAGLCADWKLDAQAIMAALMHDTIEDYGVTKTELIERFGAPTAELVDGADQARQAAVQHAARKARPSRFRKMLLAMARDVRVILDQARRPAAQHAHDGRDGARASARASRARRWTSTRRSRTAWA
ncbi:MAG: HD domain-containing protein [Comamonadaceae bacterium]|nr:HD domain-containing protein [Comamonadaceae bacterium]